MAELKTNGELLAQKATELSVFRSINLLGIKSDIEKMLGQIGRGGIFDEYTKHDITHIDNMLILLERLIPKQTKEIMKQADWLLIVLSFYFHDLGMLVTRKEFEQRMSNTRFKDYYDEYNSDISNRESLKKLSTEQQERFIYQEYVRKNHGKRIADWLKKENEGEYDEEVVGIVQDLVKGLKSIFIHDLANVCASHMSDDLDNRDIYPVKQEYGMGEQESANVFYAALMLRTADMMHITDDRTPSVEFQIISPTNPVSQIEWAKQASVTSVSPKEQFDSEGNVDMEKQSDTLSVTGLFESHIGFFPLMDYLNYAREQLLVSYKLNEEVKKKYSSLYDFPWKDIDDTKVRAKDFERRQLSFTIDQHKILDLLVGETLYNNLTVSLREIAQNAIDAVKVRKYEQDEIGEKGYTPQVYVNWDPKERILIVTDNGIGMDMSVIENHLLKVGSSRYRDNDFIKKHQNFTSISRFGIGLLSCFLVADDVDILTCMNPAEKPLLLKVSKLHGKYLLKHGMESNSSQKLMDKVGTSIQLRIRPNIDFDPEKILHEWIMFPSCDFRYKSTDGEEKIIGFPDTKKLLESVAKSKGISVDGTNYRIVGINENGIDFSILMKKQKYIKEWSFVDYSSFMKDEKAEIEPCGLCIEGIRIDNNTPGFKLRYYTAIINLSGKNAPQTNVARTSINSLTQNHALGIIYKKYLEEINRQVETISQEYSKTWAATELPYILDGFTNDRRSDSRDILLNKNIFNEKLKEQKFYLIEHNQEREFCSLDNLKSYGHFWMIDSAAYTSAMNLIREIKSSNLSIIELLRTLYGEESLMLKDQDIVLNSHVFRNNLDNLLVDNFEPTELQIFEDVRWLNVKWEEKVDSKPSKWICPRNVYRGRRFDDGDSMYMFIQNDDSVKITSDKYEAIKNDFGIYILKGSEIHSYLHKFISEKDMSMGKNKSYVSAISSFICHQFNTLIRQDANWQNIINDYFNRTYASVFIKNLRQEVSFDELAKACSKSSFSLYTKSVWYRNWKNY